MLKIHQLFFEREKPILAGINFSVKKGQFIGLVGPSGAGKSTLLKIIAGQLDATSGKVILESEQILGPKDRLIAGHPEIELVNQDFKLDLFHTVEENLRLKCLHLTHQQRDELITELLDLLELSAYRKQKASQLSGGEQQRLALARALAGEPKVILLDEPFVHLDVYLKEKIISYLRLLKKIRKTTFILVTHDGQEVLNLADQIIFFNEGKIQRIDEPLQFYLHPTNEYEGKFFGVLNQVKINKKVHLFRPADYFLVNDSNLVEISVEYKTTHFFGLYSLDEFKYKKQSIFLLSNKNNLPLSSIFIR